MRANNSVSILGCGWLGLPLGNALTNVGYAVKGSTTTLSKKGLLEEKGIEPYHLNLSDEKTWLSFPTFLSSEILIVSFPPGIRAGNGQNYLHQINTLIQFIKDSEVKKILFISSTSVYPDLNKIITEDEDLPIQPVPNILREAEIKFQELVNQKVTIVRFAGLVGGSRHPGRFFAGKKQVANPKAPVNLIHLDDCIHILMRIIKQDIWGKIFNACADEHPSREEFYTAAARALNLEPPHFALPSLTDRYKIISNTKIKAALGYQFIYSNPLGFL